MSENNAFRREHPEVAIPPDYILYESHQLRYKPYFENGLENATRLKDIFQRYTDLNGKKVLDWGCGPARIVRHFPKLLPNTEFYGTDYNSRTIAWNQDHIREVSFYTNGIKPPTQFPEDMFDGIYGLSIFTHLSEQNHVNWISELHRISKIKAIIIVTSHGAVFKSKLTKEEQQLFDANVLVIQGNTLEGHRTYTAFHPPERMRQLVEPKFEVLEHQPGINKNGKLSQDIWVLKKR